MLRQDQAEPGDEMNETEINLVGRIAALETILTCLVWHWGLQQRDPLAALATVMDNAEQTLLKGRDAAGDEMERAAAEVALQSFRHITEAMLANLVKQAPEPGRGH